MGIATNDRGSCYVSRCKMARLDDVFGLDEDDGVVGETSNHKM